MKKECIICRTENPFYGWTGYAFFADQSIMTTGWCKKHEEEFSDYANPVFENREALELFKQFHPILYNRNVKNRPILFLDTLKKPKIKSRKKPLYSPKELSNAEKELRADFLRVKEEQDREAKV